MGACRLSSHLSSSPEECHRYELWACSGCGDCRHNMPASKVQGFQGSERWRRRDQLNGQVFRRLRLLLRTRVEQCRLRSLQPELLHLPLDVGLGVRHRHLCVVRHLEEDVLHLAHLMLLFSLLLVVSWLLVSWVWVWVWVWEWVWVYY